MARMYFNFNTNIKRNEEILMPSVDYIAFHKGKNIISVGCNGDSDFGVTNKVYGARFKGLEVNINDNDYYDMTENDFEALKGAEPYEIGIYVDEADKVNYKKPLWAKNLHIDIQMGDNTINFRCPNPNIVTY